MFLDLFWGSPISGELPFRVQGLGQLGCLDDGDDKQE